MALIRLASAVGITSTIFSFATVVANGVFATSISREIPGLVGLQAASITLCVFGCVVQLFITLFLIRRRREKRTWLERNINGRSAILLGVALLLFVVVEGVAVGFSATKVGDISAADRQRNVRKNFSNWCGLWVVSIILQGVSYGLFVHLSRNAEPDESIWDLSLNDKVSKHTVEKVDEEKTGILSQSPEPPQESTPPSTANPETPSESKPGPSRISAELDSDTRISLEGPARSSMESHTWVQSFSRRVPGLHDELMKIDPEITKSTVSLHRQCQDQSSDRFESSLFSDTRSVKVPSPSLHASTRRNTDASEVNIHPLFRSDSSITPVALPGTVLTASPLAGRTISMETLIHIRSQSPMTRPRARSVLTRCRTDEERALRERERRRSPNGRSPVYGELDRGRGDLDNPGDRRSRTMERRGASVPPTRT